MSARRGGFEPHGELCFLPLALHWSPLSLLELTCGSALGWQRLRTPPSDAQVRSLWVLVDHLIGCRSKGALGRPSNPGSRGLVAHQPLLRVPYLRLACCPAPGRPSSARRRPSCARRSSRWATRLGAKLPYSSSCARWRAARSAWPPPRSARSRAARAPIERLGRCRRGRGRRDATVGREAGRARPSRCGSE